MFFDQVLIRPFTGQILFTKNLWYGIIFLGKLTEPKHLIRFKTRVKNIENIDSICLSCQYKCILRKTQDGNH